MTKIVKISGGLGNQLFQYSFGRYLELNFGFNVFFDIQTIQRSSTFTNRNIQLNELVNKISYYDKDYFYNEFLYRLKRKLVHDYFPNYSELLVENLYNNTLTNENLSKKVYYDGYWQSLKYINSIESVLRNELIFNENIINLCYEDLNLIRDTNSCSIHIRRGDYILPHNKKIFSECGIDYIRNSVIRVISEFPDSKFYVFSDDINWAKKQFMGHGYIFIDSYPKSPLSDLYLMSNCNNNIISNSTFSWWASWLNNNNHKMIICPKLWYNDTRLNEIHIKNITNTSFTLI